MKFYVARLSFVTSVQKSLFKSEFGGTPIELAEKLLVNNTQYIPKKKRGFVSLYFGGFIFGSDGRMLAAKLGKAKEVKLPDYDDDKKDFFDKKTTSYPYIYLLWDRDEQVILLERKMSVFLNYETVFRSIEDHLNNLLKKYELRVSVIPLTEKKDFWKYVQLYKYLYEIEFKLYMPNFFGNTQRSIKEVLEMFREDYNALEVSSQISNPDGNLKVAENDSKLNAVLEWIRMGGGEWAITGKSDEDKRKVTIKSSQNAKTLETSIEIENYTAEEIKSILSALKSDYSVKGDQEEK